MGTYKPSNQRIAKNTLLLYIRTFFILIITLYTSRVVLRTLGVNDFGIYNVVGGVVTMFSILTHSLSAAISRFITFKLGEGDIDKLKKVFNCSITIQFFIALCIFVLAEIIGVWFLNMHMVIPSDRIVAANWVFQCSILTFVVSIINIPYHAAIIAHEKMTAFAYIGIFEVILKLFVVLSLAYSPIDKLTMYAILLLMVAIFIRLIYSFYCHKNFEECNFKFYYEKPLLKEMFSFAGWNFIGSSSAVIRDQGDNIVINLFCGPAVNAARGLAFQVNNAVNLFVTNFQTAFNPVITKSYATDNKGYMMNLIFRASRVSVYLLLFLSIPLIIELRTVLHLWLGIIPEHTVLFVELALFFSISDAISKPLITAILATGDIKKYQIIVGGIQLLNLPLSYVFLRFGSFPEVTLVIAIILSQMCFLARLFLLRRMINLDSIAFVKKVYFNVIIVGLIAFALPLIISTFFPSNYYRFFLTIIISSIWTTLTIFFIGCSKEERTLMIGKAKAIYHKLR